MHVLHVVHCVLTLVVHEALTKEPAEHVAQVEHTVFEEGVQAAEIYCDTEQAEHGEHTALALTVQADDRYVLAGQLLGVVHWAHTVSWMPAQARAT